MKETEKMLSADSPLKKYPIGSTIKYRRGNEIIDLTVDDYDSVVDIFKLTGIIDDLPLELNMSSATLSENTISAEEMNLKYPIGSSIGYKVAKMDRTGRILKTINNTGEEETAKTEGVGTVYGFKDGRYIILMIGGDLTPVKEENLYELDTKKAKKIAKQIEKIRTTLRGPFGKLTK